MLYLIGLGLYDEKDLSLRALEILKGCDEIYAELYTGVFRGSTEKLEELTGKPVRILRREDLEEKPEENVLRNSRNMHIALLVPGDPLVATTHIDLILRARKLGIETKVIHSSSIYSAIGETGLQLYKFGKTTTLAFPEKGYFPTSPYDVIKENLSKGLHTLILLDVKAEEKRFMTVKEAIELLLDIEHRKTEGVFTPDRVCVGAARLGGDSVIKVGTAESLRTEKFGDPPHILIVPGKLHFVEEEALEMHGLRG